MPCGVIGCAGDVDRVVRLDGKGQRALCAEHATGQVVFDE
jgi:hypothetical protein